MGANGTQTTYKRVTEQQSGRCESNLHQQHCHHNILITRVEKASNNWQDDASHSSYSLRLLSDLHW